MNKKVKPARSRPPGAQRQRDARLAKGLTLQDVADWCHVSKESARLWEAGRTLRGHNLLALAKLLDLTPEALNEGRDPHEAPVNAALIDEMNVVLGTLKLLVAQIGKLAARVEQVQRYE